MDASDDRISKGEIVGSGVKRFELHKRGKNRGILTRMLIAEAFVTQFAGGVFSDLRRN